MRRSAHNSCNRSRRKRGRWPTSCATSRRAWIACRSTRGARTKTRPPDSPRRRRRCATARRRRRSAPRRVRCGTAVPSTPSRSRDRSGATSMICSSGWSRSPPRLATERGSRATRRHNHKRWIGRAISFAACSRSMSGCETRSLARGKASKRTASHRHSGASRARAANKGSPGSKMASRGSKGEVVSRVRMASRVARGSSRASRAVRRRAACAAGRMAAGVPALRRPAARLRKVNR